jgi:hypothetical protein
VEKPKALRNRTKGGLALSLVLVVMGSAALLVTTQPAWAVDAADKGTARNLALEGMQLYQEGKPAEALKKLQAAQSLFDAPVHLLYIARCQTDLGMLVEAAETYRVLGRVQLAGDASAAFHEAKTEGEKELGALEARIPVLRIEVEPAGLREVSLTIDGVSVSSAAIGADRPANPGRHEIEVSAPGYGSSGTTVTLREGNRQPELVSLTLQPVETGDGGETDAGPSAAGLGFMAGLRIAGVVPAGQLDSNLDDGQYAAASDLALSDVVGSGAGLELHGGLRFARYYSVMVFGGAYALVPKPGADDLARSEVSNATQEPHDQDEVTTTAAWLNGGVGVTMEFPIRRVRAFAGAGLLAERLMLSQEVGAGSADSCTVSRTYAGGSLRLAGGVLIPLVPLFGIAPYASMTMGTFSDANVNVTCDGTSIADDRYQTDAGLHTVTTVGVAGDFFFGGSRPR